MRISVIGMGHVGSALGQGWVETGHAVTFCVRDPENRDKRTKATDLKAAIGPLAKANESEVTLLAVPWSSVPAVLEQTGDLAGQVLLDCTNPVNRDFTELTIGHNTSAGEQVAEWVPRARVVKIFNTNGSDNMRNPNDGGRKVSMLYAGDDGTANEIAAGLAAEIGFEPIYLGPLKESRLLEPLAMTWIRLARHRGWGRNFALDVVRRSESESGRAAALGGRARTALSESRACCATADRSAR